MFYFVLKSEKRVTKRNDSIFEANLLTKETSSQFLLIGSLKMTDARSYAGGFIKPRGLGSFFAVYLTQTSKITMTCSK